MSSKTAKLRFGQQSKKKAPLIRALSYLSELRLGKDALCNHIEPTWPNDPRSLSEQSAVRALSVSQGSRSGAPLARNQGKTICIIELNLGKCYLTSIVSGKISTLQRHLDLQYNAAASCLKNRLLCNMIGFFGFYLYLQMPLCCKPIFIKSSRKRPTTLLYTPALLEHWHCPEATPVVCFL